MTHGRPRAEAKSFLILRRGSGGRKGEGEFGFWIGVLDFGSRFG